MFQLKDKLFCSVYIIIALCLVTILGILYFAFRFSSFFDSSIYRSTAFVFMAAAILAVLLSGVKPKLASKIVLAVLPLGARLSSSLLINLGEMNLPVDVLLIWLLWAFMVFLKPIVIDAIYALFIAFVFSLVISYCINPSFFSLEILIFGVLTQFMVYQIIRQNFRSLVDVEFLIKVLTAILMICSIFAFIQPFTDKEPLGLFLVRIPSIFYNPIIFANVLVLLWPFCLAVKLPHWLSKKWSVASRFIMIIVSLLALLLTGSRGGLIIFGLQMLVLVGSIKKMSRAHSRVAKRILSFIIPGSTVIVLGSSEYITNTLLRRFAEISFNVKGNSSGERLLGLLGGLQIGFENPLFGVGLGNFRNAYPYTSASQNGLVSLESAHNFIINLFAEGGVAAVLIWLLIILLIGKRLRDSRSFLKKTGNYMLYLALFISFWGFVLVTFAFYGEFFHKGSGLPIILYCTVMATISILSRQRHCSRMFGEEMEK